MRLLTATPASGKTIAMTPLEQRAIDILATEELAADMRKAEAECIRRGWLNDYRGDGTLELTEAGKRHFFEWLASSEHTRH
jgi:hypothetical protein